MRSNGLADAGKRGVKLLADIRLARHSPHADSDVTFDNLAVGALQARTQHGLPCCARPTAGSRGATRGLCSSTSWQSSGRRVEPCIQRDATRIATSPVHEQMFIESDEFCFHSADHMIHLMRINQPKPVAALVGGIGKVGDASPA